jgi:hypothetical protein
MYGLDIGFIDTTHTPLGTTSNDSATANLHNSQFTTSTDRPFPACCVFNSRSLATASNSGESSAFRARSYCHSRSCRTLVNSLNPSWQLSTPELSIRFSAATASCQLNSLPSLLSYPPQLARGPRYIASGRTQQITPLSPVPLFL